MSPSLYKVNIPEEKLIEITDWASPRPQVLALELASYFTDKQFKFIADNMSTQESGNINLRPSLFKRISEKLLPDIKAIYYKINMRASIMRKHYV